MSSPTSQFSVETWSLFTISSLTIPWYPAYPEADGFVKECPASSGEAVTQCSSQGKLRLGTGDVPQHC